MTVRVQTEVFDIGTEIATLTAGKSHIGALASFMGLVRDLGGEDALVAMTLEHYPGMTEKALTDIEAEARARWPLDDVLIVHRYGRMEPGEPIVLVVTTSAHRHAAFDSCQFLMDWLKTKAPFWKLEETATTGARWVEAKASDDIAAEKWG